MRSLTYKFRLYPTEEQQAILWTWSRALNDLYNHFIDLQRQQVVTGQPLLRRFDLNYLITDLRTRIPHLDEVYSNSCQGCSTVVSTLMTQWRYKNIRFPKHRSGYNFFTIIYPDFNSFKLTNKYFKGGKLPPIKVVAHRPIVGIIKTASIKCDEDDRWWVCLSAVLPSIDLNTIDTNNIVGIDMGCSNFLATSDGYIIKSPKFIARIENGIKEIWDKIDNYHRGTGSKKDGIYQDSRRCRKLKKAVRRLNNQRTRMMRNFMHTRSHAIISRYDVIVAENLHVSKMIAEHNKPYSNTIREMLIRNSTTAFRNMLAYKSKKYIEVNPAYTSQTCSLCGQMSDTLTLADRTFKCTSCGVIVNRDINAAVNVRNLGLLQELNLMQDSRARIIDVSDQIDMCNTLYPCKAFAC